MAKNHMVRLIAGWDCMAHCGRACGCPQPIAWATSRSWSKGLRRMAWRIGIDIGGTFTDVAMVEEATGRIGVAKVLTTPKDFGQGVIDGLRGGIAENAIEPATVALLSHATTVVTKALLEHKGAKCGFINSRGFRDLLELR